MFNYISAAEIDSWSKTNPRRAQEILPELIIRLILATSNKIISHNFPIEKGIQFAGYDGVLESEEQTNFFPKGKSVWECGTNENLIQKFDDDIKKRTEEPLGVDIQSTVFIFVTLKIWNHRTSIEEKINDSKSKYKWADIQIFDASKICLWIEQCPAVLHWMAVVMGEKTNAVCTVEQYWEEIAGSTIPFLKEEFFLIGRDKEKDKVSSWITQRNGCHVLSAESSLEAIMFLIATISKSENKEELLNRTLIVNNEDAWNSLIKKVDNKVLLIPMFNFVDKIKVPTSIFTIVPTSYFSPIAKIAQNVNGMRLDKRYKNDYHKALESLELDSERINLLEHNTKRSFIYLYREITDEISKKQPQWLSKANIKDLIPAMFAGAWNGDYEGDRELIETLSGEKYETYISKLTEWINMEEAPVFRVMNAFQVMSVPSLWMFVFDKITDEYMSRFKESILSVFGYENQIIESEKEKSIFAEFLGKKSKYSYFIQNGMAISLIMLNEKNEESNNLNGTSTRDFVSSLIKEVLNNVKSWHQWSSIAPLLPTLVEAAPEQVLDKIENEVRVDSSPLWYLFKPAKDSLFGKSYYTYILWTIEKLVWYEEFVISAILLLVNINEKNFEYKITNSPENSLYEIFCLWHPQSCLSLDDKIAVLKRIIVECPNTGWRLIKKLLPSNRQCCMSISKPKWHSFETSFETSVTNIEYHNAIASLFNIMLENIDNKIERLEIVIDNIEFFGEHFEKISEMCISYIQNAGTEDRLKICDNLRSKISRKRRCRDADWSISEEYISKMEEMYNKILPNVIGKDKYLFKWRPDILHPIPYDKENFDYDKEKKHLFNVREEAIKIMFEKYSLESIIEFCGDAEDVNDLAVIIYKKQFEIDLDFDILMKFKDKNINLYSAIVREIFQNISFDEMVNKLNKSCLAEEEKASILCQATITMETIEGVNTLEERIKEYYWSNINSLNVNSFDETELIEIVIKELLEFNRPFSAIKLLNFAKNVKTELIILALEKSIELSNVVESSGMIIRHISSYDIHTLFKKIYDDENVETITVAKLECWYLPFIKDHIEPKYIIKILTENPMEYVILISRVFKSDREIEENLPKEYHSENDSVIELSRNLLQLFKDIPGCNSKIKSQEVFDTWIARVKKFAEEAGYKEATEVCIGKLLSYSPLGEDGIFPHEIIRNYFEKNFVKTEVDEFVVGKYNQRGVHALSGGINEKEISDNYYENANKLRISYPNTARILKRMGENYKQESLFERNLELRDFWG